MYNLSITGYPVSLHDIHVSKKIKFLKMGQPSTGRDKFVGSLLGIQYLNTSHRVLVPFLGCFYPPFPTHYKTCARHFVFIPSASNVPSFASPWPSCTTPPFPLPTVHLKWVAARPHLYFVDGPPEFPKLQLFPTFLNLPI